MTIKVTAENVQKFLDELHIHSDIPLPFIIDMARAYIQLGNALVNIRIMATDEKLAQDGKSECAGLGFRDIEVFANEATEIFREIE